MLAAFECEVSFFFNGVKGFWAATFAGADGAVFWTNGFVIGFRFIGANYIGTATGSYGAVWFSIPAADGFVVGAPTADGFAIILTTAAADGFVGLWTGADCFVAPGIATADCFVIAAVGIASERIVLSFWSAMILIFCYWIC